jgi:hypothetical protein
MITIFESVGKTQMGEESSRDLGILLFLLYV